ncbi:unnamed protein product [Rodentolepis nana]|uniref:Collagen-like protein n=1 Tax=Rodentolepis nana TaxID=102285 RepID=A0A0R3TAB3_RODNA|nr:unnamed protein product [Rodentolepis nana]
MPGGAGGAGFMPKGKPDANSNFPSQGPTIEEVD